MIYRFVLLPTSQRLGHAVQERDPAFGVRGDDRIADARQRHAEQIAALPKAPLHFSRRSGETNDDGARQEVDNGPDQAVGMPKRQHALGLDEEEIAGQVSQDSGQRGRTVTANPGSDGHGCEQRDEWQPAGQHGLEK